MKLTMNDVLAIRAVATCCDASRKSPRPILQTVRIQPSDKGVTYVATDSYALAWIHRESVDKPAAEIVVPQEIIKALAAVKGFADPNAVCAELVPDADGEFVSLTWDGNVVRAFANIGDFPQWRELVPDYKNLPVEQSGGFAVALAPRLLARLNAAADVLYGKGKHSQVGARLRIVDKIKPVLWTFDSDVGEFSLLQMPVKVMPS